MKKKYIVKQNGVKECGSACILSLIKYYGGNESLYRIVELTKTDKNGTNFYDMKIALEKLGLSAKGYSVDKNISLGEINTPFIAQIVKENYEHFVVVYKVLKNKVIVMDPAKGNEVISFKNFEKIFSGHILIAEPFRKLTKNKEIKYFSRKLLPQVIKNNKKSLIKIFILSFICSIFACLYSFYFQMMVNKIHNLSYLKFIMILFVILILSKNILNYIRGIMLINLNKNIDSSLMTNAYNFILKLPFNYYKNKTTGEIISRINDLQEIKQLVCKIIITLFFDVIILLVGIIILYNICAELFVYVLFITALYLIIFVLFKNIIKKLVVKIQENNSMVSSLMVESISGFESIKGLNVSNVFERKFYNCYRNLLKNVCHKDKILCIESLLKELSEGIILVMVIYKGFLLIDVKMLTLGSLITFNSLFCVYIYPLKNIIDTSKDYFFVSSALRRVNDLFEVELEDMSMVSESLAINGFINIKNLNFSYNQRVMTLKNINLVINNKAKVLLLGATGSGKSTLIKLLYKYYQAPNGTIFLGDYDINAYALSDIRNEISIITQNEYIFTGTLKENITLNRDIDYKDFLDVCRLTYVDEIVGNRITGYDYILEENGLNLSGGQRQRVILARTLLKDSKIILIDEGLSQIDINMERKILKNIFEKYNDRLFIIISHRHENIDLYSQVIELQNGMIYKDYVKQV